MGWRSLPGQRTDAMRRVQTSWQPTHTPAWRSREHFPHISGPWKVKLSRSRYRFGQAWEVSTTRLNEAEDSATTRP